MNNKHLKLDELTRYFLNNLTRDNETCVQEHLNSCAGCSKKLENIRLLKKSIFEKENTNIFKNKPFFKIISSNIVRYAAAAVIVIGTGIGFYLSKDSGYCIVNEGISPADVFSIDSLSRGDNLEYYDADQEADSTLIEKNL